MRRNFVKTQEEYESDLYEKHPAYKLLSKYNGAHKRVEILCDKGHHWFVDASDALRNNCGECYKRFKYNQKTNDDFISELVNKCIPVIPLEEYKGARKKIKFQCCADKEHIFEKSPSELLHKSKGCPFCNTIKGAEKHRVNSLKHDNLFSNVHPKLISLLEDKSLADKYSFGSTKVVSWICPTCQSQIQKSFKSVSHSGLQCSYCSNWQSYPNNFMYSVLMQLGIEFQREFCPKWADRKRYDFYFSYQGKEYIVEMDGGFHYVQTNLEYSDLKTVQKTDSLKDSLAKEYEIEMIRINCFYYRINERFNFIKENVLKSRLGSIFDLSTVDFSKADKYACIPSYSKVAELWNSGMQDFSEIAKILKYNIASIYRIFKKCKELNLINE